MPFRDKQLISHLICLLLFGGAGTAAAWYFHPYAGIACLCAALALIGAQLYFTLKRYREIAVFSDYLLRLAGGDFSMELPDYKEGELSMLKTNLYKTVSLLRYQADEMQKGKLELADSLADISHQLKTPVTSMMVMSDLLKNENLEPSKRVEFLANLDRQLEKTQWIITNLLKLSKLDSGQIQLKNERFDLTGAVTEAAQPFQILAEVRGVTLKLEGEEATVVKGDRGWTIEAIGNLIKNCIEHTPAGGCVEVACVENALYTLLTIRDNGTGIAEEDLPHIFERFYKGKNSGADSVGIGLALAKLILNRENAMIDVKSREHAGTKFEVRFYQKVI